MRFQGSPLEVNAGASLRQVVGLCSLGFTAWGFVTTAPQLVGACSWLEKMDFLKSTIVKKDSQDNLSGHRVGQNTYSSLEVLAFELLLDLLRLLSCVKLRVLLKSFVDLFVLFIELLLGDLFLGEFLNNILDYLISI